MKRLLAALSVIAALGFTAAQAAETLTVAAASVLHAGILSIAKPPPVKGDVELKVKEFTDYVQPNVQASERRLDANFLRHQLYPDEPNKVEGTDLVTVTGIYIESLSVYSSKYKKLDELSSGATAVIPNDAINDGHALLLLDKVEVTKFKDNKSITATSKDIADNPKNIGIREPEAATPLCVLTQVDMVLINTDYTLEVRLNPVKDALIIEGSDSPYVNILVARPDNKDSDATQKLVKAPHSAEVKQFIQEKYKGAMAPAF